jgi:hypothetical protein
MLCTALFRRYVYLLLIDRLRNMARDEFVRVGTGI